MRETFDKVKKNIQNGSLIKNGSKAIKNRIIKKLKHHNAIYLFDKDRVKTKKYLSTIPKINSNHSKMGNYYVDNRIKIEANSIVYSLGILLDISFDLAISNTYGCSVYMYDPTPSSISFMKMHQNNKKLIFSPFGVWTEEATLKFYEPKLGGSSSAICDKNSSDKYFEAKCFKIEQLLIKNQHKHIHLFKADIEGAALPVIEQMLEQKIYPDQLVLEFERPKEDSKKVDDFFNRVSIVRKKFKSLNYLEYQLPRSTAKYLSLELLFVNKDAMKFN